MPDQHQGGCPARGIERCKCVPEIPPTGSERGASTESTIPIEELTWKLQNSLGAYTIRSCIEGTPSLMTGCEPRASCTSLIIDLLRATRGITGFGEVRQAAMGGLVTGSAFSAIQSAGRWELLLITGVLSIGTVVLASITAFMGFEGRASGHYHAATAFQGVRREIEEELTFLPARRHKGDFRQLRARWTAALKCAPPLPEDIHDEEQAKEKAKQESRKQESRLSARAIPQRSGQIERNDR
jgi:hypothetical protein